jgi:predicted SprT family Zn-dependent metalloprotease
LVVRRSTEWASIVRVHIFTDEITHSSSQVFFFHLCIFHSHKQRVQETGSTYVSHSPLKMNKNPAEAEKVVQTFILLEVVMQGVIKQLHQLHPAKYPRVSEIAVSLLERIPPCEDLHRCLKMLKERKRTAYMQPCSSDSKMTEEP